MRTGVLLIVAFAATALYRFLPLTGFSNDHHVYLAGAQQILRGYWPTRDWVDPGMPLMFAASAAAQLAIGRTQYAEALLVITAYGAASCAIVLAARRLSGSLAIAALAALAAVLIFPRTYAYPKILLYAVAPLTWAYYLRRPGTPAAAVAAGWVTIAGLFRHDHGVFLGAAGFLAILLTPAPGGAEIARRCVTFIGLVILMAAPYALYIAVNGGIGYIAMGFAFSAAEAERSRFAAPAFSFAGPVAANAEAWLYYLYRVLPGVAAVVTAVRWMATGKPPEAPLVVALIAAAVLVNNSFLRDPLRARLPDAIVPNVLLAAWLAGRAFAVQRRTLRAAAIATVIVLAAGSAWAVTVVGEVPEQVNRGGLADGPARVAEYVSGRTRQLRTRFSDRQVPHGHLTPLVPFFRYLDRCAPPSSHLLVAGFAPELFVYARRPFAAGMTSFVPGYHDSPAAQQAMVARMMRQTVPFTLAYSDGFEDWQDAFPIVAAHVRGRFAPMTDIPTAPDRALHVLVDTRLTPVGRDPETQWPCFR